MKKKKDVLVIVKPSDYFVSTAFYLETALADVKWNGYMDIVLYLHNINYTFGRSVR